MDLVEGDKLEKNELNSVLSKHDESGIEDMSERYSNDQCIIKNSVKNEEEDYVKHDTVR